MKTKLLSYGIGCCLSLLTLCHGLAEPKAGSPQRGVASWYKEGSSTASGERYNPQKMTAAHRTLPFGTMVRVTNLSNQRSTTVRINDRGPYKKGRVIDLSQAAAKEIQMIGSGVASVEVVRLAGP